MYEKTYIPKVLVAGDLNEFREQLNEDHKAEIVGNISFEGKIHNKEYNILNNNTLTIDGKLLTINKLRELASKNTFDYIIFLDCSECMKYCEYLSKTVVEGTQIITMDFFLEQVKKGFYSFRNQYLLHNILAQKGAISLLDFDSFFFNSQFYLKPFALSKVSIEGFSKSKNYPMINSFYDQVYDSLEDCRFRHYDTILLTSERTVKQLLEIIKVTNKVTNEYLIFNSKSNEVVKSLVEKKMFSSIQGINCVNGTWFFLNNRKSENLSIFVVTHKKYSLENLPRGYVTIHAGRELGKDLGYIGDNTGDNISKLNPYLNELTAMYWIWKNTSHDYVGTAHYRRFFSNQYSYKFSEESILTAQQAYELLREYDIIIGTEGLNVNTQNTLVTVIDSDGDTVLANKAFDIMRNMLKIYQPAYLDAFDKIRYSQGFFYCNMLITRKHIYDAFCEWLFSFVLPTAEEFLKTVPVEQLDSKRKRILGFCAERMMSVWLLKQNLKIKDFPIMVNE